MAVKKKKVANKKTITSASALKTIDGAITNLTAVVSSTASAIAELSKEKKTLLTAAKRLARKRATLVRKKKVAASKLKKDATAANKKLVDGLTKEIATIKKEALKVAAHKSRITEELAALKVSSKRVVAYAKAISAADKMLNKPKKKRRLSKKTVSGDVSIPAKK